MSLYRRKGSRAWVYDVTISGQRFVRTYDASLTRTQAQNLATVDRRNYLMGEAGIRKKKDISFETAARLFLESSATNPKRHTVRGHKQCVAQLAKEFSGKMLRGITTFGVEGYKRKRARSPIRANRELAVLKLIYNRAIAWGKYEGTNPVVGVKPFAEPKRKVRWLDDDEETRLLAELDEPHRTIIVLGLYAGLRVEAEALTLTWGAVDLRRKTITVETAYAKSHRARELPLHPKALEALERLHSQAKATGPEDAVFVGRRGPLRSIRTVFERARKKAGLRPDVGLHTMRHYAGCRIMPGSRPRAA